MRRKKQSRFWYRITKIAAWFVAKFTFKRKILRNEIKGKRGPFVIIANHQAAFDFTNLIGASSQLMTFVVSDSFYNTLPIKGVMNKVGVIPKQQFQTTVTDIKRMRGAIDAGKILVIYPAGLMCEDGASTPIPEATYKFLKWIGTDIYMARISGTYFVTPKWSGIKRRGRTTLDIYKLFDKEDIAKMDECEIKRIADEALIFDAYHDQEKMLVKYKNGSNVEGLHNVLYKCPHCQSEFTIQAQGNRLFCTECGYEQECDEYGFLHNKKGIGEEIRYPSDWSKRIYEDVKQKIVTTELSSITLDTKINMIDYEKKKFVEVGKGTVALDKESFTIKFDGEKEDIKISNASFVSLPFKPGAYIEVQKGPDIYRLVLNDGKLAMKLVNMVKAFYELNSRLARKT